MAPSDFKNANIDEVLEQMTTDEAILLTAGVGFWHTHGVPRLGVPPVKVSDGPNGQLHSRIGHYTCMSTHEASLRYPR